MRGGRVDTDSDADSDPEREALRTPPRTPVKTPRLPIWDQAPASAAGEGVTLDGSDRGLLRRALCLAMVAAFAVSSRIAAAADSEVDDFDQSWRWARFTKDSGLPSERVNAVVETPSGVVWAATDEGLAWYDGFRWIRIGDLSGLPEGAVSALARGGGESVLVQIGARVFRGDRGAFLEIPLSDAAPGLMPRGLTTLPDGTALILVAPAAPGGHAALLAWHEGQLAPFVTPAPLPRDGSVWLGGTRADGAWMTTVEGLHRWERGAWRRMLTAGTEPLRVSAVADDGAGGGVIAVDGPEDRAGIWEWGPGRAPAVVASEGTQLLRTLALAVSGEVMAIYRSGDVRVRRDGVWTSLHPLPDAMRAARFAAFRPNGDLWVGTDHGLFLFRRTSKRWTYWRHPFPDLRNRVHDIVRARDGAIWLATADGVEVHRLDGTVEHVAGVGAEPFDTVTALCEDGDGAMWLGSGSSFDGAWRWDGRAWTHIGAEQGLHAGRVHRIRRDSRGRLWFLGLGNEVDWGASAAGGPGAYVLEHGVFTRWGVPEGLAHGRVYAFVDAPDGSLWFGTLLGISRWRQGQWTHWSRDDGLRVDEVHALAIDARMNVWFAHLTAGAGVGVIDLSGRPRYVGPPPSAAASQVWDVASSRDGRVWIATSSGLACWRDGMWSSLDVVSGLAGQHVWPLLPAEDRLYVGTLGAGVCVLDLAEADAPPPRVELHGCAVSGDVAIATWRVHSYWGAVPTAQLESRYQLDSGPWSEWSFAREAQLEDLPPGPHVLRVQAKGLFSEHDPNGVEAKFSVEPPLYARSEFAVPVGVLSLALLTLVIAYGVRQRRHDRELRTSEQRYRDLFENANAILYTHDLDGRMTSLNRAGECVLGPRAAVVGRDICELAAGDGDAYRRMILATVEGWAPSSFEVDVVGPDGTAVALEVSTRAIQHEGRPVAIQGVARDVSWRKRAEAAIAAEKERLAVTLRAVRDGVLATDPGGNVVLLNRAAEELLGWAQEEAIGRPLAEVLRSSAPFVSGEPGELVPETETSIVDRRGRTRIVAASAAPLHDRAASVIGRVVAFRDVTETRRVQEELLRAQKLESLAVLAGGIAHDFNNVLTGIVGNVSLARLFADRPQDAAERLEEAEKAALRARDLTQQLLTFSRGGAPIRVPASIGELVRQTAVEVAEEAGGRCQVTVEEGVWNSEVDPGQMAQAVGHLVANAVQAMPKGQVVQIAVRNVTLTGEGPVPLDAGEYVSIAVEDHGVGIPEEHLARVFDPYFTTKARGKGLGLATTYSIVMNHGGHVAVRSQVGEGATFTIWLPAARESVRPAADPLLPVAGQAEGNARVLVMDDEPVIRQVLSEMLGHLGYQVVVTEDGAEAVDRYREAKEAGTPFDVVITDLSVPGGMGGREAMTRLREIDPNVRAIVSSGYSNDPVMADFRSHGFAAVVPKPYRLEDLAEVVRRVLASVGGPGSSRAVAAPPLERAERPA